MLALGGKVLNFRDKGHDGKLKDPIARFVKGKIDEIRDEYTFPVKVSLGENAGYKPDPYKRPNYIKYPTYGVPMSSKIPALSPGEMGTETWTYYETSKQMNSGKTVYEPRRIMVNGKIKIDSDKIDLLFYLLYCSPMVENSKNSDIQKMRKTKKPIVVDNPKQIADKYVAENKNKVLGKYLLLADDEIEQSDVVKIAKYFGVRHAADKGDGEVRVELIKVLDARDIWEDFIDALEDMRGDNKSTENIQDIIVLVQEGFDAGVLYEKNIQGKNSIMAKGREDSKGSRVFTISDEATKVDDFAEYLKDNADILETLTKKIK